MAAVPSSQSATPPCFEQVPLCVFECENVPSLHLAVGLPLLFEADLEVELMVEEGDMVVDDMVPDGFAAGAGVGAGAGIAEPVLADEVLELFGGLAALVDAPEALLSTPPW